MPSSDELMSRSNRSHRSSRVKSYQGTSCVGIRRQWSVAVKIADKSLREEGEMLYFGLAAAACLALFSGVAGAQPIVVPIPTVEGPITGPGDMQPGIRPGPEGT